MSPRDELVRRWQDRGGQEIASEVFTRLLAGRSLNDLGLADHEGRVDLRGISAPSPAPIRTYEVEGLLTQQMDNIMQFRGVRLENLDFSGSRLESFRFSDISIRNCEFDNAYCQDWRLWRTQVSDTSFRSADLRHSLLGAADERGACTYTGVDFSRANLRDVFCDTGLFADCDFADAALAKSEFDGTRFIHCRFRGLLHEITFHAESFDAGKRDPDALQDVDFSEAELRWVQFRLLNLDRVRFPSDADHLVIHHYRCVLERAVEELARGSTWPGLRKIFGHYLKWAGPRQEVGVFNRKDFAEFADEDEVEFRVSLLRRLEQECAQTSTTR